MHYSSFPGRINVEKTSEQCFQPLSLTENQKSYSNMTNIWVQGGMVNKWMMEMDWKGLYIIGETLHKWGMGKIKTERHWKRITVTQWRINLQEQPIYLKTCSSDIHSIMNYVSFPPRTGSKPLLTVRKLIKNPVLSLTLLQIYCIGLIGLVTHFLWVWAAICDPTFIIIKLKFLNWFLQKKKFKKWLYIKF